MVLVYALRGMGPSMKHPHHEFAFGVPRHFSWTKNGVLGKFNKLFFNEKKRKGWVGGWVHACNIMW